MIAVALLAFRAVFGVVGVELADFLGKFCGDSLGFFDDRFFDAGDLGPVAVGRDLTDLEAVKVEMPVRSVFGATVAPAGF